MGKAAIPAVISAAGSIAGGALSMGGKGGGGKTSPEQNALFTSQRQLIDLQKQLAQQEAARTAPLRNQTADTLNRFLSTGTTPSFLDLAPTVQPLAASSLPALEDQRNLLQRRLLAGGIRGGQLQGQLAQADLQGALQRSQLLQQDVLRQEARDIDRLNIRQKLFGGAADIGTGGLSLAFQGLSGAAGTAASAQGALLGQQQLQQQRDILSSQGAGQLLGKGLSTATGFLPSSTLSGTVLGSKLKV